MGYNFDTFYIEYVMRVMSNADSYRLFMLKKLVWCVIYVAMACPLYACQSNSMNDNYDQTLIVFCINLFYHAQFYNIHSAYSKRCHTITRIDIA